MNRECKTEVGKQYSDRGVHTGKEEHGDDAGGLVLNTRRAVHHSQNEMDIHSE